MSAFKDAEPKKGGKLKKFVLLSALAGIGALVFKKLKGDNEAAHWQKSYTPTPAPSTTPSSPVGSGGLSAAAAAAASTDADAPAPDAHDDLGAASPDEAIADSVEQPHEDTTPDQPLEVVEIDTENK